MRAQAAVTRFTEDVHSLCKVTDMDKTKSKLKGCDIHPTSLIIYFGSFLECCLSFCCNITPYFQGPSFSLKEISAKYCLDESLFVGQVSAALNFPKENSFKNKIPKRQTATPKTLFCLY